MQSSWPFAIWGIDLIRQLPKDKGGVQYTVVAVDYFTKWTEAEPLSTITSKKVQDFIVKNIICRFRLPYKIVLDNGKQFDSQSFTDFCANHGFIKNFSAVAHPQANGQVEAVNKTLKDTLKKKLEDTKGNWSEELPKFLWSYRTTEKTATGQTPFAMTYGYEAMLPVELEPPFHRRLTYSQEANHKQRVPQDYSSYYHNEYEVYSLFS
ncbi:hypothetical protein CsatB_001104 [Cannabis sativa]|uniref:uncharacterized protein LOC133039689 n=1 Tax=Cannabis sativa TaxID=3483 RepID=UPI0029C9BCBD|nr:uncharacterized protein LOC133039689 [Cannabis sativa]